MHHFTDPAPASLLALALVSAASCVAPQSSDTTDTRFEDRAGVRFVPMAVGVDSLWVATTEITVDAYEAFVTGTGHSTEAERAGVGGVLSKSGWENRPGASWREPGFEQEGGHPVVLVSWADADAFCRWLGGRLPTELEWESAARGGRTGRTYVWGENASPVARGRRHANVADRSASGVSVPEFATDYEDGAAHTAAVGSYEPNELGIFDLAGNVLEWTAGLEADGRRIARGGAWNNPPTLTRITRRSPFPPSAAINILGFRCVRDDPPASPAG